MEQNKRKDGTCANSVIGRLKSSPLLSGSTTYFVSNVINAAIPFALLPVLTRYLSPAEYGEVAIFQTLLGALSAFVGLNVVGAAARKYYDGDLGERELKYFIAACLQILLASAGVVFAVIFVFRHNLTAWLGLQTHWILLAVFVSAASVVVQLRLGQWQVRKDARRYGALQVSQSALNMLLSVLLVVVLLQGAAGRMAAQVWTAGLIAVLALILLMRDKLLSFWVWTPVYLREALKFGIPLVPHVGGAFLIASVDRFVINGELGLADTGMYMVAVQLTGAAGLLFEAINNAYVPWLFERLKRDRLDEKRQIVRYTYAWFSVILICAALGFAIGPWLVSLIAGEKYGRAGEVFGWLALGQAFGGMYLMVTNYSFYSKRTGLLSVATITAGLVNIALLLLLVRLFGLQGAAVAFSISMAVRFLLTWWVAQRRHPMPWFDFQRQS
jgi:O-antigen/teichoic acid export membrane protein